MNLSLSFRTLASLLAIALPSTLAVGQVWFEPQFGPALGTASGDPSLYINQPFGFTFPMAGSTGTITGCSISSNGTIDLSGFGTSIGYAGTAAQLSTTLRSRRTVAALWDNLEGGTVHFIALPQRAVVTWHNVHRQVDPNQTPLNIQCQLWSNGDIWFWWSAETSSAGSGNGSGSGLVGLVGVSPSSTTDPGQSNLSSSPTGVGSTVYEVFSSTSTFDLNGGGLKLTKSGNGYNVSYVPWGPASHTSFGSGCDGVVLFASAPPRLGNGVDYVTTGLSPSMFVGITFWSVIELVPPIPIPGNASCSQYLDISPTYSQSQVWVPSPDGHAPIVIPSGAPSYIGWDIIVQSGVIDINSTISTSNPLRMHVGP